MKLWKAIFLLLFTYLLSLPILAYCEDFTYDNFVNGIEDSYTKKNQLQMTSILRVQCQPGFRYIRGQCRQFY